MRRIQMTMELLGQILGFDAGNPTPDTLERAANFFSRGDHRRWLQPTVNGYGIEYPVDPILEQMVNGTYTDGNDYAGAGHATDVGMAEVSQMLVQQFDQYQQEMQQQSGNVTGLALVPPTPAQSPNLGGIQTGHVHNQTIQTVPGMGLGTLHQQQTLNANNSYAFNNTAALRLPQMLAQTPPQLPANLYRVNTPGPIQQTPATPGPQQMQTLPPANTHQIFMPGPVLQSPPARGLPLLSLSPSPLPNIHQVFTLGPVQTPSTPGLQQAQLPPQSPANVPRVPRPVPPPQTPMAQGQNTFANTAIQGQGQTQAYLPPLPLHNPIGLDAGATQPRLPPQSPGQGQGQQQTQAYLPPLPLHNPIGPGFPQQSVIASPQSNAQRPTGAQQHYQQQQQHSTPQTTSSGSPGTPNAPYNPFPGTSGP
ncbi:hypothetical protein MPDQ_000258 [Monascus purpureus]|uniref:Uncharacterized protein n=1 Tax=Monascus purpureus TaxID=5098 RepID=A0A507QU98_MONPU|nr:hypothetical protein MPDQ_000258 [Monascus purpureus]